MSEYAIETPTPYELIWHEPRQSQRREEYETYSKANLRILQIRHTAREWNLYHNGKLIDCGFYARS